MDDRLVIGPYHGDPGGRSGEIRLAWSGVPLFGALLALAGTIELLFAVVPLRGAASPVIFAVLSGAAGAFATLAVGLVGGMVAAVALGKRGWVAGFVLANALVVFGLLAGVVGYLGAVTEVRAQIPALGQGEVTRAVTRTLLLAAVSAATHGLAIVWGLRARRAAGA